MASFRHENVPREVAIQAVDVNFCCEKDLTDWDTFTHKRISVLVEKALVLARAISAAVSSSTLKGFGHSEKLFRLEQRTMVILAAMLADLCCLQNWSTFKTGSRRRWNEI